MAKGESEKRSAKRAAVARSIAKKGLQVSSALLTNEELTDKQKAYVECQASGLNKKDSTVAAGYHDSGEHRVLDKLPAITEALAAERAANARATGFSRKDVLDGIKKAIDDACILADPMAQIAGWREVAKICGYYAPEIKQIQLTAGQLKARGEMELLSDDELLRLATSRPLIEGESTRVDDHDEASRADRSH